MRISTSEQVDFSPAEEKSYAVPRPSRYRDDGDVRETEHIIILPSSSYPTADVPSASGAVVMQH